MRTTSDKGYYFFLFVFWPLLAIIRAFRKNEYHILRTFLPLFTGILGYVYQPKEGSDVMTMSKIFYFLKDLNFTDKVGYIVQNKIVNILNSGLELYIDLLSLITSLFTDNVRWLFFFMGYIYGVVLYNLYIRLRTSNVAVSKSFANILLFFCILLIQPSMAINGRFWLATLLFLNFILAYYNNPKFKYILLSIVCIFIHKGFLIAVGLLFIWHLTKTIKFKKYLYMTLLFASIITPGSLMLNNVKQGNALFGDSYNNQIEGYTNEDYIENSGNIVESRSAMFNFYGLRVNVLFYGSVIFLFFLFYHKNYNINSMHEHAFYLIILFISFSNFFIEVPSLGSRYRFITIAIMLVYFYKSLVLTKVRMLRVSSVVLIASMSFYFIINLRMEFEQMYGFSYILNPALSFLLVDDMTVMDLLK